VRVGTTLELRLETQRVALVREAFGERKGHRLASAQRFRAAAAVVHGYASSWVERIAAIIGAVGGSREINVMPTPLYRAQDGATFACKGRCVITPVRLAARKVFHAVV